MKSRNFILLSLTGVPVLCSAKTTEKPNVIVILADDLGYGDVSAYGSRTLLTPNIDNLANHGVCFTNGYATSATSTPSRYALLTGMYPWKNKEAKILPGDAPLIISPQQYTLPKMMKSQGYKTGAIGKWHLGMGKGNVDWNQPISPSANTVGFDYTCLIAATADRVPCVFVENGKVAGLDMDDPLYVDYTRNFDGEPTALTHPEMLKMKWSHGHNNSIVNGIPRIGFMKGGEKARWVDENIADYFVAKVRNFIKENKQTPFFLYYGLHEPHVPRVPNERFVGTSGLGPRGDAVKEADWCVGELINTLKKEGLLDNTLIIFSSDNGPVLDDGYVDGARERNGSHNMTGGLRGGKYSLFEGGTQVPFFVYWNGKIPSVKSDALVSQLDIMASIASLLHVKMPQGIDSKNYLNTFLGKSKKGREEMILEASGRLALRTRDWIMIPPYKGSVRNETGNELGNMPDFTLFNRKSDPTQKTDVATQYPKVLDKLTKDFYKLTSGYYNPNIGEEKLK